MFRGGGHTVAYAFKACSSASGAKQAVKKLHTSWPDGSELVEEYDAETHRLTLRKRRRPAATGAVAAWEVLLGDAAAAAGTTSAAAVGDTSQPLLLQESSANPRCVRVDTPGFITWHVTHLPYPKDTYRVTLDEGAAEVVVAATNKKFYKRLAMPEMQLLRLAVEPSRLSWDHADSTHTLTIHYAKPPALLAEELADSKAAAAMRAQEPPTDCRQQ